MDIKKLIQDYKSEGYVVLPNAVSQGDIKTALSEIHILFIKQLQYIGATINGDNNMLSDMSKLFHADITRYKDTLRQVNKLVSVYRNLTSKKIIEFVNQAGLEILSFPTDSVFHCMAGDLLIPDGYMRLTPHQDWPAMQGSLDSVIVWSSFMDVLSDDMFPLEVIPQSHLNGLLPGITHEHVYEVAPEHYDANDFMPIHVNKGDVVIFSSFLIHRTGQGNSNNLRLACSMRYENVIEPTNIERSYPNIHSRTLDRTIRTENFPIKKDVQPIFS